MLSEQVLYIVATPIGHRDDISARAIEVLRNVDRVYAEDTRHSLQLLRHHGIEARLWALHEHNEEAQIEMVLAHLRSGHSAALISDAGTPLISDPGFRLVRACQQAGLRVSPIPGACALTAALSVCGLPTDRFQFVGFPPARRPARLVWLAPLANLGVTQVFYESPHRIIDCLQDIQSVFGADREVCIARELTKRFETVLWGQVSKVLSTVTSDINQQKGEFVLVVAGVPPDNSRSAQHHEDLDRALRILLEHLPVKKAARVAADLYSLNKRDAYDRALILQGK